MHLIIQLPCWDSGWKTWTNYWNKATSVQCTMIKFIPTCSPMYYLQLWTFFRILQPLDFLKSEIVRVISKAVFVTENQLQMTQQIIDLNKARAFIVTSQCSTCFHCDVTMQYMLLLWHGSERKCYFYEVLVIKVLTAGILQLYNSI